MLFTRMKKNRLNSSGTYFMKSLPPMMSLAMPLRTKL